MGAETFNIIYLLVLNRDMRGVESNTLTCGKISRSGRDPPHAPHRDAPDALPPMLVTDRAVPVVRERR